MTRPEIAIWQEEDWWRFDAALPGRSPRDGAALLTASAILPGPAKVALNPRGELCLRAEIPCTPDRRAWAQACLNRARALLAGAPPEEVVTAAAPGDLEDRLREAGWPVTARGTGAWRVALEARTLPLAEVSVDAGEALLVLPLAPWDRQIPPRCARAAAHLLLHGSAVLRLARAAILTTETDRRAALMARLPLDASGVEFCDALEALRQGARILLRETRLLLSDDTLARHYLAGLDKEKETHE